MTDDTVIPVLPCGSLGQTLDFYRALGFEVTHQRARALAARTELAVALGEAERALALRAELKQIPLSDEQRERFRDELHAADDLERLMS